MLYLNGEDVRAAIDCERAMQAVERALLIQESGAFEMPDRTHVQCSEQGLQLLMPCVAGAMFSTKLLTVFPGNREQGLPIIDGILVINDRSNGSVQALLDAKAVTAIRTGAVTGVSVRHLASVDARTLGVVGCGVQARDQISHSCAARSIERIFLHSRRPESANELAQELRARDASVSVECLTSADDVARASDILISATTARQPVFSDDPQLFRGKHCVAIGSFEADVREYPDAVFEQLEHVWVDTPHARHESGELMTPLASGCLRPESIESLGQWLSANGDVPRGTTGTTFFKSVGMALFDLELGREALSAARAAGLGQQLDVGRS
ncbi:MAG: ornithine cyclodeaminase/alanine dehydrogenase-like protein (mu-crystallin family) [Planctomycetota bacterium]|jgi:ornithine cyclodeaminase/alanine dehydrogenase-like protein (mu-crystallin family)